MLKMMIHMRRYAWMLAAVVVLLAAQAACELWLPTYTAAIVDVGIQQEGVESPVPEAVREYLERKNPPAARPRRPRPQKETKKEEAPAEPGAEQHHE